METLQSLLEQHGLDQSVWISKFHENNIIDPTDIEKIGIKQCKALFHEASEEDTQALQKLLGIELPSIEKIEKNKKETLEIAFENMGLDQKYWPMIFTKILGTRSIEALEYMGSENYAALEPYTQGTADRLILRKLTLHKSTFEDCRGEQIKQMDKRNNKIKNLLEALRKVKCLSIKQNMVSSIFEMLQIIPDIPSGMAIEDVINKLDIESIQLRYAKSDISDTEVFTNSHKGYALKGIFVAPTIKEQTKMQKDLLKQPKNIKLLNPRWSQFIKVINFTQKKSEDMFMTALKHQGISVVVSEKYEDADVDDDLPHDYEVEYRSTLQCVVVPMAACYLDDQQLNLSSEALEMLKEIENIKTRIVNDGAEYQSKESEMKIPKAENNHKGSKTELKFQKKETKIDSKEAENEPDEIEVQQACERFFQTFGSHAYKGIYHFGGVFVFKIYTENYKNADTEKVRHLQNKATEFVANSIWLPEEIDIQNGIYNKEDLALIQKIKAKKVTVGGPDTYSSYFQWKNQLTASNESWGMIDCGTDVLPVWKIIQVCTYIAINKSRNHFTSATK